jgi:two-component system LytT family response regulator
LKRIAARSAGKTVFVEVDDLDWIRGAENYAELHAGPASHLLHVTMNTLEKSLDPEIFLRIHRSIIVNLGRIRDLQPGVHGEYSITLQDGTRLQSGRTYADRLRALANNPF